MLFHYHHTILSCPFPMRIDYTRNTAGNTIENHPALIRMYAVKAFKGVLRNPDKLKTVLQQILLNIQQFRICQHDTPKFIPIAPSDLVQQVARATNLCDRGQHTFHSFSHKVLCVVITGTIFVPRIQCRCVILSPPLIFLDFAE